MLKEIVKSFDMGCISDMINEFVRKSCVSVVTLSKEEKEEEEVSIVVETVEPTKIEGRGESCTCCARGACSRHLDTLSLEVEGVENWHDYNGVG